MKAKSKEKLGLYHQQYFPKNLRSLRNYGGQVSMIDCFIIKKYPIIEKIHGKTR